MYILELVRKDYQQMEVKMSIASLDKWSKFHGQTNQHFRRKIYKGAFLKGAFICENICFPLASVVVDSATCFANHCCLCVCFGSRESH